MAADSAVVGVLPQPVPALVLLVPLAVVLLAGDRNTKKIVFFENKKKGTVYFFESLFLKDGKK